MKVTLKYLADKEYEATNEEGNSLKIDMYSPEEKKHMSPTQLLLSGLVACGAVDIVSMVKKKRKTFIDLRSEVDGIRNEDHPRKFNKIHIKYTLVSPDMSVEDFEKVVNLAVSKYCSVASTINESTEITHSVEVVKE